MNSGVDFLLSEVMITDIETGGFEDPTSLMCVFDKDCSTVTMTKGGVDV